MSEAVEGLTELGEILMVIVFIIAAFILIRPLYIVATESGAFILLFYLGLPTTLVTIPDAYDLIANNLSSGWAWFYGLIWILGFIGLSIWGIMMFFQGVRELVTTGYVIHGQKLWDEFKDCCNRSPD